MAQNIFHSLRARSPVSQRNSPEEAENLSRPIDDEDDEEEGFAHRGDDPTVAVGLGGCCCCILCVVMIFVLCSYKGLPATKHGMKQNNFNSVVDMNHHYTGGRRFMGFWNGYVQFPATLVNLEWLDDVPRGAGTRDLAPMTVRTSDGVRVQLGMALQYQINPNTLGAMYHLYKMDVEQNLITKLRARFTNDIATRNTSDLWEKRPEVQEMLFQSCKWVAENELNNFVSCWDLQLLSNDIPEAVERTFIQQQVMTQNAILRTQQRNAANTRADTAVIESQFDGDIAVVRATADADAYRIRQTAQSDAELMWAEARASALQTIEDELTVGGVSLGKQEIVQYFERVSLIRSHNATMTYGDFQKAVLYANQAL